MKAPLSRTLAWTYVSLMAVGIAGAVYFDFSTRPVNDPHVLAEWIFPLIPLAFAFVGALIVSRQPGNRIGLMMMVPAASLFVLVDAYLRPFINGSAPLPVTPSPLFLLILWFSGWNWLLLVFPLMYIMALFPNGRPLSSRWGWLNIIGCVLAAVLIFFSTFIETLAPGSGAADWSYPNPIGFIQTAWVETAFIPFFLLMPVWVGLSAVSLFVRFRRVQAVEREQIKWLFYAGAVFALCYIPLFIWADFSEPLGFWNVLWGVGMLAFPAAIAIAILRYRLFDIDIIIRKTLVYALLSGLLGLVYFGGVVVLQGLLPVENGQLSPIAVVVTTLALAALFNPLRRRIQDFIDRRFYRRKYDGEKALAEFAAAARSETDLGRLSSRLTGTVQETLQPEAVSLWMAMPARNPRRQVS